MCSVYGGRERLFSCLICTPRDTQKGGRREGVV